MELKALLGLLLALLGPRTLSAVATTETTTTETTTTETTTTETTTTDSTTAPPAPPPHRNLTPPGTPPFSPPRPPPPQNATLFPTSNNASVFFGTSGSVFIGTASPRPPPTNGSSSTASPRPPPTNSSRVVAPPRDPHPTSPGGGGRETNPSALTGTASVGTPEKNPTAKTVGGGGSPNPDKSRPPPSTSPPPAPPGEVKLLLRVPLSFRVLNRNFSRDLLQPGSSEHRALSYRVLSVFDSVYGCAQCTTRHSYKGCSELSFSQGSVLVRSTLVFGRSSGDFSAESAVKALRGSVDRRGFIMELQLADIQSGVQLPPPAWQPAVPGWAVALLVLVCVLLLLSALTCALLTTCSCRRKSRGKLDVFSQKDSYRPMAAHPPYQSHGRYAAPAGKHNPYSQVAGTIAGGGTFTYTNPSAGSDNL